MKGRPRKPLRCEVCQALVDPREATCPYCEAPLPLPGFFGRHLWEIGGAIAGAFTGGIGTAWVFAILLRSPRVAMSGWPLLVLLAAPVIGALGGAWWGYRMRTGRAQLYDAWDDWR